MPAVRTSSFSVRDFRTLPETRPALEFYGGRVIQKLSPKLPHSVIQGELLFLLFAFGKQTQLGQVYPELRCTFGGESHVFDLSVFIRDRRPDPADRLDILEPPDLAIGILSPGQTVGELTRKLQSAIRRGVRLGWLIDEGRRSIPVFRPRQTKQVLGAGDILLGEDVLPGFVLPVDELSGWIDGTSG